MIQIFGVELKYMPPEVITSDLGVPRQPIKPGIFILRKFDFKLKKAELSSPALTHLRQSRPIEMRATILYLANPWTEFEMLLTPLRFLYLVMFSLLAFPSIPQFIAHFWQISSFLCIVLPFSNSYRNESCSKACSAHFAPAAILFFFPFCE